MIVAIDPRVDISEFFGHVRGAAFTGADADKKGLFEAAGDGILFLDEIGDLPLSFQPHLLRVLQTWEFRKIGSPKTLKASCKVVAAAGSCAPKAHSGLSYTVFVLTKSLV